MYLLENRISSFALSASPALPQQAPRSYRTDGRAGSLPTFYAFLFSKLAQLPHSAVPIVLPEVFPSRPREMQMPLEEASRVERGLPEALPFPWEGECCGCPPVSTCAYSRPASWVSHSSPAPRGPGDPYPRLCHSNRALPRPSEGRIHATPCRCQLRCISGDSGCAGGSAALRPSGQRVEA